MDDLDALFQQLEEVQEQQAAVSITIFSLELQHDQHSDLVSDCL